MYCLIPAALTDVEKCFEIIKEAKEFQKEQGFIQWTDEYPDISIIKEDILTRKGYILTQENKIAAYLCVDFSGEPAYENIVGKWTAEQPYAVIHRMALNRKLRNTGLSSTVLSLVEKLCLSKNISYIRVYTDSQNKRMQHILEKNHFSQRGTIIFQGGEKIAYDKLLD